jgi:hypothetical protein
MSLKSESFIVFGCWNKYKDGIDPDQIPIKQVTDKIKEYISTVNTPKFLVIAGDNYYPGKEYVLAKDGVTLNKTKNKIINPIRLKYGFDLLPKNITTYMILGNHDLDKLHGSLYIDDTSLDSPAKTSIIGLDAAEDCAIIKNEIAIVDVLQQTNPNFFFEFNKSTVICNTLVLMIDTSIYDDIDAGIMLPCYIKFMQYKYPHIPIGNITVNYLLKLQSEFIFGEIAKYSDKITNIIFIGHHPISGLKYKNNAVNQILPADLFINMLYSVFTMYNEIKYYYICADLHNYQIGTLTIRKDGLEPMTIKQYIVGTGGTDLDTDPLNVTESKESKDPYINNSFEVTYSMTPRERDVCRGVKYGFLECICQDGNDLHFVFYPVDPDRTPFEGGVKLLKKSKNNKRSKKWQITHQKMKIKRTKKN